MSKYAELDKLILSSVNYKPKSFSDIYFGSERGTPDISKVCQSMTVGKDEPARVLDRRLQALRKRGLIQFVKGWRKTI